jgi:hypothetical protein
MSVALVMRHTKVTRPIILSLEACLPLTYFPTISHKRHDFRKNAIEHKMCVFIFFNAETLFILR